MRTAVDRFKWMMMAAILGGVLTAARSASAATSCTNDINCADPGGPVCGGQVCDYTTNPPQCAPADAANSGQDGWCTVDTDCKCHALGATCNYPYCTFTVPPAGSGGTGGGTGGATGAGGAATGGTTGTGGAGKGGATGTGGSTGKGGSSSETDGGTSSSSSSGCSVAGGSSPSLAGLMIAFGTLVAIRRRRRRG